MLRKNTGKEEVIAELSPEWQTRHPWEELGCCVLDGLAASAEALRWGQIKDVFRKQVTKILYKYLENGRCGEYRLWDKKRETECWQSEKASGKRQPGEGSLKRFRMKQCGKRRGFPNSRRGCWVLRYQGKFVGSPIVAKEVGQLDCAKVWLN